MAANNSVVLAPASWAAAVEPADVPMVTSAVVTSKPASKRPAMTPISHAFPVDPPPPRTSARSPAAGNGFVASDVRLSEVGPGSGSARRRSLLGLGRAEVSVDDLMCWAAGRAVLVRWVGRSRVGGIWVDRSRVHGSRLSRVARRRSPPATT